MALAFCVRCGGAGHEEDQCPSDPGRLAVLMGSSSLRAQAARRAWQEAGLEEAACLIQMRTPREVTREEEEGRRRPALMRAKAERSRSPIAAEAVPAPSPSLRPAKSRSARAPRVAAAAAPAAKKSAAPRSSKTPKRAKAAPRRARRPSSHLEGGIERELREMVMRGGVMKELKGLNVPWPYSRFLLDGSKTVEARRYQLGSYLNAELWIVETPGRPDERCDPDTRPTKARIVGTVVFGSDAKYPSEAAFLADADRHRIPPDAEPDPATPAPATNAAKKRKVGVSGWDSERNRFAWTVKAVRALDIPVSAPLTKGIIGCRACRRCVVFADVDPDTRVTL